MNQAPGQVHLEHARALLTLLEQETEVLQAGRAAQIRGLCSAKIEKLQLLQALLEAPGASARQTLGAEQRAGLRELLLACEERNRINEALLRARLNRSSQATRVRRGAPASYDQRARGAYEMQGNWRGLA